MVLVCDAWARSTIDVHVLVFWNLNKTNGITCLVEKEERDYDAEKCEGGYGKTGKEVWKLPPKFACKNNRKAFVRM
jgi:hypothetical protein